MNRSSTAVLACALALLAACSTDVVGGDVIDGDQTSSDALVLDEETGLATRRLYFGVDNGASVSDEQPWFYGDVVLLPDARVDLALRPIDGGRARVGFNVFRVADDGRFLFVGGRDARGGASARLSTRSGGHYVIEVLSARTPASLVLTLDCASRDGRCAPLSQPGELCGTRGVRGCDDGLFCAFATPDEGQPGCGADDRGGQCQIAPEMCPAVMGPPMCGCDGKTWFNACHAQMAGTSIAHGGACECDPSVWTVHVDEQAADVRGLWQWQGTSNGMEVVSTLVLDGSVLEGRFRAEQVHSPACLHNDPPCLLAASRLQMSGTWTNQGFAIQLSPEGQAPEAMAQSFMVEGTCDGGLRLSTTELGEDRVYSASTSEDPCALRACAADEHCALVEVQCIRAPCPPLPQCQPN